MATTFLEPGGDAIFSVGTTTEGFWNGSASGTVATDFVHGGHLKSLKTGINTTNIFVTNSVLVDAGSRISLYFYINALPTAISTIFYAKEPTNGDVFRLKITSAGVLQLWNGSTTAQIGSNGSTLSTGIWYRISLAYKITNGTTNRFELFVNGVSDISITNATIGTTGSRKFGLGSNATADTTFDRRYSDIYIDNLNTLVDTGNIWVTAKRPVSNGTTNGFTTQIGSGGSGYGSGHALQVNERPISDVNGWSMIGAGSAITEEYTIEAQNVGDIDITGSTIIDYEGWVSASALVSETASIVVSGSASNIALTSTITMFEKIAGSTTYPVGGTDIGITTSTTLTTVSLYECGVLVAFIPSIISNSKFFGFM